VFHASLKINTIYFPNIRESGERRKKEQNLNEMGGILEVRDSLGGFFNCVDHLKGNYTQLVDIYTGMDPLCMSRTHIHVSSIFHFSRKPRGGAGEGVRCQKNETLFLMVVQYTDDRTALYRDQDSGILVCENPATNKLKNEVTEFLLLSNTLTFFVSRSPKDM